MGKVATLYDRPNYENVSVRLSPGNYPLSKDWSAQLGRDANDWVSAIKVPAGLAVVLYQHKDYGGKALTIINKNIPDLNSYGFHDIMSSVKVVEVPTTTPSAVLNNDSILESLDKLTPDDSTKTPDDSDSPKKISTVGWMAIILGILTLIGGSTLLIIKTKNK
jgi:hypothetical protein